MENTFNLNSAKRLLIKLRGRDFKVNDAKIEQAFLYSLLTVVDEIENSDKYDHLSFVEFLEMLCRLALELIVIRDTENDGIEYKVYKLLQLI